MKIQLYKEGENCIDGYVSILYSQEDKLSNLEKVINNSCEYIIANNVTDFFAKEYFDIILNLLVSKLRIGGTLVITGLDINLLSKNILNGNTSLDDASNAVSQISSVNTMYNLIEKLEFKNLKVDIAKFMNNNYEIFCTR
jgi:hypothetical protein